MRMLPITFRVSNVTVSNFRICCPGLYNMCTAVEEVRAYEASERLHLAFVGGPVGVCGANLKKQYTKLQTTLQNSCMKIESHSKHAPKQNPTCRSYFYDTRDSILTEFPHPRRHSSGGTTEARWSRLLSRRRWRRSGRCVSPCS